MAAITVGELRVALPPGTALLGGAAGLGRAVAGTATYRARTPAFPALHGGELAIVPLALLRQVDPQSHLHLDRLVSQLAGAGIAAIALVDGATLPPLEQTALPTPVASSHALPPESRRAAAVAADAHALPLFVAPAGTTAEQIDLALHRHLAGQRAALLQRSQQLQQEFAQLALSGRGLAHIVAHLATVSGYPAAWEVPTSLDPVVWSPPAASWLLPADLARSGTDLPALLRAARLPLQRWSATANGALESGEIAVLPLRADTAEFNSASHAGHRRVGAIESTVAAGATWRRLVLAVRAGEGTAGFLSLIAREPGSPSANGAAAETRLALTAAGLAVSIEIMRARTASEVQGSALAGLLHDWLTGRLAGEALEARAGQLGLPLRPPLAVVVFETDGALGPDDVGPFAAALAGASGTTGGAPPLLVDVGEGQSALIVPILAGETLAGAAASLHAALARRQASAIFAGIGRVAETARDVPRAFGEAQRSLAVARRLGGMHRVAYFGTLGVYRVLAATTPDELAGFRAETLGPLLKSDERGSRELLRTLETYLACGGSPQETALRLHTHRNTVLYRLQRIGAVLGVDVRAPEAQFTLWLALRAADVLGDPMATSIKTAGTPAPALTSTTRRTRTPA